MDWFLRCPAAMTLVAATEAVSFERRREFPGIEVRSFEHSAKELRCYTPDFEFLTCRSWQGEIWHRRRKGSLALEKLLCAHPEDVFLGRTLVPGSLVSLTIDREVLASYLAEHDLQVADVRFRWLAPMSRDLAARLARVHQLVRPGHEVAELEEGLVELVGSLVRDHLEGSSSLASKIGLERSMAERVRECLHHDLSGTVDLATLAKQTGMSRFRALRVFKRWYGLPPYAYQLRVRLGLAQKSLREGRRPAEAAMEYGFVDQSHLTRHFRRLLGVTPAEYARIGLAD